MKKIYRILCLGILFSASMLHSQPLNGVYTIDDTAPSSTTNFTSFTQFASTLNAVGVGGPVTVNVGATSGPYNEQININQYAGASATNSVVINGNGRTITFNATNTALRHTIMLSGADYMTWNNLRVIGTNATSALVVHLWNNSNYNTFNGMYIEAPVNGTSSTQVPFSISGGSVSAVTSGTAGSFNSVNSCTMVGGYYGVVYYGNFASLNEAYNEINNSIIRDFYLYGFYNQYCQASKVRGNVIDRLNRTSFSTTYGIYFTSSYSALIERNWVRELFPVFATNTCYGIIITGSATASNPHIIRNNVISDIENHGTLAGIYLSGPAYVHVYHNTISLDDQLNTTGTTYGIYSTGPEQRVFDNNITITRAGTGTKYGLYYSSAALNMQSDYNNVYINSTAGTNYFGYYGTTNYSTLAAWQAGTGQDANSLSLNPQYANPATYDYSPTNVAVNNEGLAIGIFTDILNNARSPLAPDIGAFEVFNTACSTAPPANSFIVPSSSVCAGAQTLLTLQNTNTYTNSGYVVQWYASTVTPGGFVAVPNANGNSYFTSPIMQNTYYQAVVTCSNTNQSSTTAAAGIYVVPPVYDTVPYFESFESQAENGLPNCSWSSTFYGDYTRTSQTPQSNNRAPKSGTGYAYFSAGVNNTNYFYTNQLWLESGVTYSAAVHYLADAVTFNPWSELSLLVGLNQTPAGLQNIATVSPLTGQLYTLLSGTFTVNITGYYHVAIKGVSGSQVAPYLTLDDLSVTIPCSLNSPTISVLAPTAPVCQGVPVNLTAVGATTYSWSDGTQGSANTVAPLTHTSYVVYGYSALTGCASSVAINLTVTPSPVIAAVASNSVCPGQSTTLTATGGLGYYWSTGSTSSVSVVTPTISTTYQVAGTNSAGCTATAQVFVHVSPSPVIIAKPSSSLICQGEPVQLSVTGANSYVWLAPSLYSTASLVTVTPQSSTMYTVTGTTQDGCSVTAQVMVVVNTCNGLADITGNDFRIFPNPATDRLFIQTDGADVAITITDVAGRVVAAQLATGTLTTIELRDLSAGVYYVRLQGNRCNGTQKIIRQ